MKRFARYAVAFCLMFAFVASAQAGLIWDLGAVDATGNGTDPMVGATPIIPPNPPDVGPFPEDLSRVTIEGIALSSPNDFTTVEGSGWRYWQIYVQSETESAAIAVWQGKPFSSTGWPPDYPEVNAGDRVRVNGFVADHRGKSNINSRHSDVPHMDFIVTVLQEDVGMPGPVQIPSVSACNYFDPVGDADPNLAHRHNGAETYQAQWCQLRNVWMADTTGMEDPIWGDGWGWGAGKSILITDASGATLPVYLSGVGDFGSYLEPTGTFSVTGIFDQEDPGIYLGPGDDGIEGNKDDLYSYTDNYRLWVKNYGDFSTSPVPEPGVWSMVGVGLAGLLTRRRRRH